MSLSPLPEFNEAWNAGVVRLAAAETVQPHIIKVLRVGTGDLLEASVRRTAQRRVRAWKRKSSRNGTRGKFCFAESAPRASSSWRRDELPLWVAERPGLRWHRCLRA